MTQSHAILALLRDGPKTTSEIIEAPYGLAAEYRRAISDLRREGYDIRYTHGKRGTGYYALVSEPPRFQRTTDGQLLLA